MSHDPFASCARPASAGPARSCAPHSWPGPATAALQSDDGGVESLGMGMKGGACLILLWLTVLGVVIALARTVYKDQNNPLNWFEAFFRTGSIIYGGGQVWLCVRGGAGAERGLRSDAGGIALHVHQVCIPSPHVHAWFPCLGLTIPQGDEHL